MRIKVEHGIKDLAADMTRISRGARKDMLGVVQSGIRHGQREARTFARRSSGAHGEHYPRSITSEMKLWGGLGLISGEWGPDPEMKQGGMSFEFGSNNQPAHNDLGRSRAIVAPAFYGEVRRLPGEWFW